MPLRSLASWPVRVMNWVASGSISGIDRVMLDGSLQSLQVAPAIEPTSSVRPAVV
ncbi:MAG: hypothetical protein AAF633_16830 [Chloroflexota bacterium]